MDEERAMKLARYRVGEEQRNGKEMTAEEVALRRQFIKTMFMRIAPWRDITDEQINNVRIYKVGGEWYVQDQDFYEYPF